MTPITSSLERFSDELNRAAYRELSTRPTAARARVHRPRLLAGSTLGLAGAGAAAALVLGAASSSPAFAVTQRGDGTVSVKIYRASGIAGANAKLVSMGISTRVRATELTRPLPENCTSSTAPTVTIIEPQGAESSVQTVTASGPVAVAVCTTSSGAKATRPLATPLTGAAQPKTTTVGLPKATAPHPRTTVLEPSPSAG